MIRVFVTGMLRSGTTLVQKMLDNHPEISVAYQPAFSRFVECKHRFLARKGIRTVFPLEHRFDDSMYSQQEFDRYLCEEYSGQHWSELLPAVEGTRASGSKEVLCEEFIPAFLTDKIHVLHLVRHPADVIKSLSYGRAKEFAGELRPLLFDLRNWRKSVGYAIHCSDHSHYQLVRFEDLLNYQASDYDRIFQWLGVERKAENLLAGPLRDHEGKVWSGNSSFADSSERHTIHLPAATRDYIETVCFPEMRYCEYLNREHVPYDAGRLEEYEELSQITRGEFPSDYSTSKVNIAREIERLDYLCDHESEYSARHFFSERVFRRLKAEVQQ